MGNSLLVAALVAVGAFAVGLPAGCLAALCKFRGRSVVLGLVVLPALVPSFLLAIGWSALAARLGPWATNLMSGYMGPALVFGAAAAPIVLLTAFAATRTLSASQLDAARLAGGELHVLRHACRQAAPVSLLAAGLAGVLTLSDPGPGQILGLRSAASEILTSFSALYDFNLAGRQCLALSVVVLALAGPMIVAIAPRLSRQLLARQVRPAGPVRHGGMAMSAGILLVVLAAINLAAPLIGLLEPLAHRVEFLRVWSSVGRTGINTLIYAIGAGVAATAVGLSLAFLAGRGLRLRVVCLGASLVLLAQPPALMALGLVQMGASAPSWADWLLRSRLTVCLALGFRLFPVAAVLALRTWGAMPASWASSAAVQGVPLGTYIRRVVGPFFAPSALAAVLLVGLLATADVSTVLLLHPPDEASLPLTIFTVMANAPESFVASLCLAYVLGAAILLAALWFLPRGKQT
jgi:ABC-type Fe3+ transport system permease subunit